MAAGEQRESWKKNLVFEKVEESVDIFFARVVPNLSTGQDNLVKR